MKKIVITPEALSTSAKKYRDQLLQMPIYGLEKVLPYMTIRPGIRMAEVVGELSGGIEFGPYDPERVDTADLAIDGRELQTFFGSVVKKFDPNSVYGSIFGASITKGEALKDVPVAVQILSYLGLQLGKNLANIADNSYTSSGVVFTVSGGAVRMSMEDLLATADVVTIHMPMMPSTHHLINAEKLALMKPTAYLINAARGPIVEEKALVDALKNHRIKGAALDVHEFEPDLSPEVAALDNIVVTPHACTNLTSERVRLLHEALDGVTAVLKGEKPYNQL